MRNGQSIEWHDLIVFVDDGSIPRQRYALIEEAMRRQAKQYPQGFACLVILPAGAKPPPDEVKQGVKELFMRLEPSMSCLGYLVEGTGFKGVAARATLISMKIFTSRAYPVYVETAMNDVLAKILPHLNVGKTMTSDVNVIANVIADARASWERKPATPASSHPTAK